MSLEKDAINRKGPGTINVFCSFSLAESLISSQHDYVKTHFCKQENKQLFIILADFHFYY